MWNRIGQETVAKYTPPILEKFYRTELRDGEDVIDNRDSTIAKELGLTTSTVAMIISEHLDEKFLGIFIDRSPKKRIAPVCAVNEITGERREFSSNVELEKGMGFSRGTAVRALLTGYTVAKKYKIYDYKHYKFNAKQR